MQISGDVQVKVKYIHDIVMRKAREIFSYRYKRWLRMTRRPI